MRESSIPANPAAHRRPRRGVYYGADHGCVSHHPHPGNHRWTHTRTGAPACARNRCLRDVTRSAPRRSAAYAFRASPVLPHPATSDWRWGVLRISWRSVRDVVNGSPLRRDGSEPGAVFGKCHRARACLDDDWRLYWSWRWLPDPQCANRTQWRHRWSARRISGWFAL